MKKDKLSFIDYTWLFVIGSIIGYIIETTFYIIKYGYYVNKQGLLYGPFKPIYGIGCVLITIYYYLIKKKSNFRIFLLGTIIGTIFEYMASLFIELVFNSYFWSYKNFSYNLNGRIYLPYCLMWGVIALIWLKLIFPYIKKIHLKLFNKKWFKLLSYILVPIMVLNVIITGLVLYRVGHKDTQNKLFKIVDKLYNENQISNKFPKFRPLQ